MYMYITSCMINKHFVIMINIHKISLILYITLTVVIIIIIALLFFPWEIFIIDKKYTGLKVFPERKVICFNSSDPSSYKSYVNELEHFIKPYREVITVGEKIIKCDERKRQSDDEMCFVNHTSIYPCGKDGNWYTCL